ncbi:MAG: hypothetical protein EOO77_32890 [Oxalobacteraceae bacterium]|nr:MAG: hypothetical protein EOO77_32890 [Oxalobacteraceae bacterium]
MPNTAEYNIYVDLIVTTIIAGQNSYIMARNADSNNYLYVGYLASSASWALGARISTDQGIQGSSPVTLTAGQTYALKLEVRTDRKTLYVGGVKVLEVLTSDKPISDTPAAKGKAGLRVSGQVSTATTGMRFDNFRVEDLV